jgi:hypothetical protein
VLTTCLLSTFVRFWDHTASRVGLPYDELTGMRLAQR